MLGQLHGPILITLDEQGRGIAIVGGVSLRVEGGGKSERLQWGGDENRRRIFLELNVTNVLDEDQQRQKIDRLEAQLVEERERLEGIRQVFNGEAYAASKDD